MRRGPIISVPGAQFAAALIPPNRSVGINGPVVLGAGITTGFGPAGAWMKAGTGRIDGPQGMLVSAAAQHCVVLSAVIRPTAASVVASNVFGAQRRSDNALAFALMTGDGTNARFTFDAAGATLWQDPQAYVVGDVSTIVIRAWKPNAAANGFVSIWVNGRLALAEGTAYAGTSFAPANSLVVSASNAASAEVYLGSVVVGAHGWRPGDADLQRASVSPDSLRDWLFAPRRVYVPVPAAAAAGNTIAVPAGALLLSGFAPTVTASTHYVSVPAGALSLSAFAPTVSATTNYVSVPAGSLSLLAYAPTVTASTHYVSVPAGALTITGYAPTVSNGAASSFIRYFDVLSGNILILRAL